jgi:Protein of unknown function (DUF1566)/Collagen triple helix repeat (20 copies)
MRRLVFIALGSLVCLSLVASVARAQNGFPLISSADVDYSHNTLTVSGTNFGLSPKVTVGAATLTAPSATATSIVANFPSTALPSSFTPGTYFLTITFSNGRFAVFTVALGATGPQGPVGPQGPMGFQGATGATGPGGAKGATGAIGPVGPQGPNGNTGSTGPTGAAGPIGPVGPQGLKGDAGVPGPAGAAGPIGPVGSQGPKGDTGPTGVAGTQGPQGLKGDTGTAGLQGPKGDTGATGATGVTGAAGTTGAAGPQGPIGLTGATGATGAAGTTGPAGTQGVTGPAGNNGTNGTNGAGFNFTGPFDTTKSYNPYDVVTFSGSSFDATVAIAASAAMPDTNSQWQLMAQAGAPGATGTVGAQGPVGFPGATGPTGATGATGAAGPQGPKGDIGATGPAGATASTASGLSCTGCISNTQLGISYAGSASQGGPANSALTALTADSATTAGNASNLNGVPASSYVRLDSNGSINLYDGGTGARHGIGIQPAETQFYIPTGGLGHHFSFNQGGDLQPSGTNEMMRITDTGMVGIGTTSPASMLHVRGPGLGNYSQILVEPTTATGAGIRFLAPSAGIDWAILSSGSGAAQGAGKLIFYNQQRDGDGGAMTIDATANVGIGTVFPTQKLDVAGSINASGSIAISGKLVIDANGNWVGNATGLIGPPGPPGLPGPDNSGLINQETLRATSVENNLQAEIASQSVLSGDVVGRPRGNVIQMLQGIPLKIGGQVPLNGQVLKFDASLGGWVAGSSGSAGTAAAGPCADYTNRFVDCGQNGTVTDTVTGLIWLKNADCLGSADFVVAYKLVATLQSGQCGLSDGSAAGSWRLPTQAEWAAIETTGQNKTPLCTMPALPDTGGTGCYGTGIPWATGVQTSSYWSSTSFVFDPTSALDADLGSSGIATLNKSGLAFVWPVRGQK